MRNEDAKKERRIAYLLAKRRGRGVTGTLDDCEDLAQEVILKKLEKPQWHSSTDHFLGDALRKRDGRPGVNWEERKALNRAVRAGSDTDAHEIENAGESAEKQLNIQDLFHLLKREHRIIAVLKWEWGMTNREIGHAFGKSEPWIFQATKELLAHLRRKLLGEGRR